MLDIKKVQDEASKEIREENEKIAKEKIKDKLRQIDKAKAILRNLERELEDIYVTIGQNS